MARRFPNSRRGGETAGGLFSSGKAPTKKSFSLTIPPVPPETYQAIASRITKCQPWLGQKAQLDKAQQSAQVCQENLQVVQEELKELEDQREQALRDVREARQAETQEALKKLEKSIQQEFEESLKMKEEQWEKERLQMEKRIEEELLEMKKAIRTKQSEDVMSGEPPQKRSKSESTVKSEDQRRDEGASMNIEATKASEETGNDGKEEEDETKLSFAKKQEYEVRDSVRVDCRFDRETYIRVICH